MSKMTISAIAGAALVGTLAAVNVNAAENPFGVTELDSGYMQLADSDGGKCGDDKKDREGKCGEGKCGAEKMKHEGKCGGDKMDGEGKCGGDKKEGEGKCGGKG